MASRWIDDPITTSTHVRAIHINQLRGFVNALRSDVGLSPVNWVDGGIGGSVHSGTTRIRAVHFTQLRDAIQDIWNAHGQGPLPNWTYGSAPSGGGTRPISRRDVSDLRTWVDQVDPPTVPQG